MIDLPPAPSEPESLHGSESFPQVADVTQDGRLRLGGIWAPTSRLLWTRTNERTELVQHLREIGVSLVLTYVALEASEVALVPRRRVTSEIRSRFEHTVDDAGNVTSIQFNTWLSTVRGRPEATGQPWVARAYGQRALVRLDAPPGQRRVLALEAGAEPEVPPHRARVRRAADLLELPPHAVPLEDCPRLAEESVVFGLCDTDWNQHVNFLTYPLRLEQLALRRFLDLGLGACVLGRGAEVAYRSACFAGETLRVAMQAFSLGEQVGIVAAFVDDREGPARRASWKDFGPVRCSARMIFSR